MKVFNAFIKWLAVLAFGLSAGLVVIIFLADFPQVNDFLLRILILISIGFVGGLFMRFIFRKGFAFFHILFGLISNVLAVLIIDYFYESQYMLTFFPIKSFLPLTVEFIIPTPSDISQLSLLLLISLPAILLFRRKRKPPEPEIEPLLPQETLSDRIEPIASRANPANWDIKLPSMNGFKNRVKKTTYQLNPANWNINLKLPKLPKKKSGSFPVKKTVKSRPTSTRKTTSKTKTRTTSKPKARVSGNTKKTATRTKIAKPKKSTLRVPKPTSSTSQSRTTMGKPARKRPAAKKVRMPNLKRLRANGDVKLTGEEDHVCPYCLEEVVKNDPAGVVVCPECSTWHHQDCWNVTGGCGVAHRNEL
jgi:hypothetical protein